jgi:hypothetical protein
MGQQFKAHLSDVVQPLIGFKTGQVKRRAPLEGQQIAGVSKQRADHFIDLPLRL